MKKKRGAFFIGTSNVVIPGNKQTFPDNFKESSRLQYYGSLFNSVEINSSFYKIPLPRTFARWAAEVPDAFRFSIKLWKEITHCKGLNCDLTNIPRFLEAAVHMGDKMGPLLIQFPGKIDMTYYNELEQILETVAKYNAPVSVRMAVEFRHPGWYERETMELLDEYGAAVVLHDIPKSKNRESLSSAPFVYLRFHGTKGDYRGSYSDEELSEYADNIRDWLKGGKDVYAYFNNTIGSAFENAMQLRKMIET